MMVGCVARNANANSVVCRLRRQDVSRSDLFIKISRPMLSYRRRSAVELLMMLSARCAVANIIE